ncbi:MAG: hypothetical protein ACRDT9_00145 [Agromyces sp.]
MSTLTIYGASDDLVEVEGEFREEFNAYGPWTGRIIAPNGDALTVRAEFAAPGPYKGEWTIAVENTGTWPAWPMHFAERADREGDPALVIDVPVGTIVEEVQS